MSLMIGRCQDGKLFIFCDSAVPCVLSFTMFFLIYEMSCQERWKQQVITENDLMSMSS